MKISRGRLVLVTLSLAIIAFIIWRVFVTKPINCINPSSSNLGILPTRTSPENAREDNLPVISLQNAQNLTLFSILTTPHTVVTDVVFSPDGSLLAAANDNLVLIWDMNNRSLITTLTGHKSQILKIAFSPDSKLLASASRDKSVRIWDLTRMTEVGAISNFNGEVYDLSFMPDGTQLVTASGEQAASINFWSIQTYAKNASALNDGYAYGLSINPSGSCLIVSAHPKGTSGGSALYLINTNTPNELFVPRTYSADITNLAISPDGGLLSIALLDETIRIWDLVTLTETSQLLHDADVNDVVFSPTEEILATASGNLGGQTENKVIVWDYANGVKIFEADVDTNMVSSVAFTRDGRLLASAAYDGVVRLWAVQH